MMLAFYIIGFLLSGFSWFLFESEESPFTVEDLFNILIAMTSSWVYMVKTVMFRINPDIMNRRLFRNKKERD